MYLRASRAPSFPQTQQKRNMRMSNSSATTISGNRARVERLLSGEFRPDDLMNLFLHVRDQRDNRQTVKETGDFVTHRREREKGIVTIGTKEWFAIAQFVPFLAGINKADSASLPASFPAFLWATYKRLNPKEFTEATKLKHNGTDRLLGSAIKKLTKNQNGTHSTSSEHTASELKLMQDLCCVLVSKPAFDNEQLFSDFAATLKSQSLLKKEEMKMFINLKPAIGLFAVGVMHNCVIKIDEQANSTLKASALPGKLIDVMAYGQGLFIHRLNIQNRNHSLLGHQFS
jgi:hypothetical protein